jgi:hypothetical protein
MKIGLLLWEVATLTVIVFGALCVFLLRSWFSRTEGEVRWGLWLRFSVVLLVLSVVGLVEGVLLSPFGFGWFLLALAITLYVVKKFAGRLLGWER